jgi:Putative Actinobacterial Holin-X, holin superfamily III
MSAPSRARTDLPPDGSQPSLGTMLGDVTRDMSQLVRQEVELAKAELRRDAKRTGQAAGMFGGAGLAGFMVLLFGSIALWWALANVMDQGWAALIVAGVWAVAGLVLFAVARARMRAIRGPRQTAQTAREIPTALKGQSPPPKGQSS